jgi:hypothetical protein
MDRQADGAQIGELVMHTLVLHAGQPLDTVLLSLAEVLARVLIETDKVTPDEGLRIVELAARKWLASGTLVPLDDWTRQAERVRVQ